MPPVISDIYKLLSTGGKYDKNGLKKIFAAIIPAMRTVNQDITKTIEQIKDMQGTAIKIKVNRGRNKIEEIEGVVENVYPSIFTIRSSAGELSSFSYSDILARNILFYRNKAGF